MTTYLTLRDAEQLTDKIRASGLRVEALADRLGISRGRLWELRTGRQPNLEDTTAAALEQLLAAQPGELFELRSTVDLAPYVGTGQPA